MIKNNRIIQLLFDCIKIKYRIDFILIFKCFDEIFSKKYLRITHREIPTINKIKRIF